MMVAKMKRAEELEDQLGTSRCLIATANADVASLMVEDEQFQVAIKAALQTIEQAGIRPSMAYLLVNGDDGSSRSPYSPTMY